MLRAAPIAICLVLLATGCGQKRRNHDVAGFVRSSPTPAGQAVLRSIATYRTSKDEAQACTLVTPRFLRGRYGGQARNCVAVLETADRFLPDSARVLSVTGDTARVLIDEPTATKSIYTMRRVAGVWKVDAIDEAR